MKNIFKTILCAVLTVTMCLGAVCIPVSSYSNDVETSTNDMILINMDTDTVVYSKKPDNKWFSGYLSTLVVYLVSLDDIKEPDKTTFKVDKSFADKLPYSDNCLEPFTGDTLTAKDLMGIMLLSSGNDAAYALATLSSYASFNDFVAAMNDKVAELGCTNTVFVELGYSENRTQHTTCRDMYYIYSAVRETEYFSEFMSDEGFVPSPYVEYTVASTAAILNPSSPYYFRYTNDAKYSFSDATYECLVLTTTYRGKTYFFAGLLGHNQREQNVLADAKRLTTWAYLNLSDRKVLSDDETIAKVNVDSGWGSYEMDINPSSSVYKTLPNDFDEKLLSYKIDVPETVSWPLFKGQSVGSAGIVYDSEKIDNIKLLSDSGEGVDMISDAARFGNYVLDQLFAVKPKALSEKKED